MALNGNCGTIIASSCVHFTAKDFTFMKEVDALECNASVSDAFDLINKYLKPLVDGNDFTGLDKDCLDFDPATIDAKGLHQLEITEICLLKSQIEALQTQINNLNIGNEVIAINLQCLTPDAAPCAVAPNQYQLISILNVLVSKICEFETRISNLES
jgi:hypothetical protein